MRIGEDVRSLWALSNTPTIGFYRELHSYLKGLQLSKTMIGKLYAAIDCNFQEKRSTCREDNVHRFVDKIVSSKRLSSNLMIYEIPVLKSTKTMLRQCSKEVEELNNE